MGQKPVIYFTVTNQLSYDQRMQRICGTLAGAGYRVLLIGRQMPNAPLPDTLPFEQIRLPCTHQKGKLFYLEYNWRLYRYLKNSIGALQKQGATVAVCAIDLDTILPCLLVSRRLNLPRVYDAHELFTELTEVKSRPMIFRIWQAIERYAVPQFGHAYTVNTFIAQELKRRYRVDFDIIRNLPLQNKAPQMNAADLPPLPTGPFLLYQGAVNEGRSFETLIPAMAGIPIPLVIAGEGNFLPGVKALIAEYHLQEKVWLLGPVKPALLRQITPTAFAGLTLFDNTGLNQYYSLANRFFDYMQAGIPQICVNYPEYAALCTQLVPAYLINDTKSATIEAAVNKLLKDVVLYSGLKKDAIAAGSVLCWENEEKKLILFWDKLLPL